MFLRFIACLTFAALLAIPGSSTTLYTTGTTGIDDNSPGIGTTGDAAAAPFSLSSQATIESVTIYTELFSWDGTMNYYLFSRSGFYPTSTPLAQGAGQNVTKTVFYEIFGVIPVYQTTFNLATPVTLNAGNYWLGVHMAANYNGFSAEWIALDGDPGSVLDAESGGGTFNNWILGAENNPFSLSGVWGPLVAAPEPAYGPSLPLFAAAFIASGLLKRWSRARKAASV